MVGEVTTEALMSFNRPEIRAYGVPGGGGISGAADLALYYQALLHDPGGLWEPKWLAAGTREVHGDLPEPLFGVPSHRTLGLTMAGEGSTAALRGYGHTVSPRAFGHAGAGGQIAFADPDTGHLVLLPDQRPRRERAARAPAHRRPGQPGRPAGRGLVVRGSWSGTRSDAGLGPRDSGIETGSSGVVGSRP